MKKAKVVFIVFFVLFTITRTYSQVIFATEQKGRKSIYPLYINNILLGKYEQIIIDKTGIISAFNRNVKSIKTESDEFNNTTDIHFYNKKGEKIDILFDKNVIDIKPFSSNRAKITVSRDIILIGYIDIEGNWMVKPEYIEGDQFLDGFTSIKTRKNEWGIIDDCGNIILQPSKEINGIENYGFGIFSILYDNSSKIYYYNANTKNKISFLKPIESVIVWGKEKIKYGEKYITPIYFKIRENPESIARYDIDGNIIFNKIMYNGLRFVGYEKIYDFQMMIRGNMIKESPPVKGMNRIRYFNILTHELSPYYDIPIDYFKIHNMDSYRFLIGYNTIFNIEQRTCSYDDVYTGYGNIVLEHIFTEVYYINGNYASVAIGQKRFGLVDLQSKSFILDLTQTQLFPINKEKWFVVNNKETYVYNVVSKEKFYDVPKKSIVWTDGNIFIGNAESIIYRGDEQIFEFDMSQRYGYTNVENLRLRKGPSLGDDVINIYPIKTRIELKDIKSYIDFAGNKYGVWMNVDVLQWDEKANGYIVDNSGWFFSAFIDLLGPYEQ